MSTVGSLFSGYGGLDLAVEHVFDATTAWHVENGHAPSRVLADHWAVPNYGDITRIDWATVEPVDILRGGWPCQPFSLAGKRLGATDERALWPHVGRAIRVLRPRLVVLENVSAVVASPEFGRVASELATYGYDLAWTCLRAGDIGAPHRRERLFIVARYTDGERLAWPELSATRRRAAADHPRRSSDVARHAADRRWHSAQSANGRGESSGASGRSDLAVTDPDLTRFEGREPAQGRHMSDGSAATNTARNGRDERWPESAGVIGRPDAPQCGDAATDADDSADDGQRPRAESRQGSTPAADAAGERRPGLELSRPHLVQDGSEPAHTGASWGAYEPAIRRWESVLGRVAPAPTELTGKGNQRLAPGFVEWMMGIPAGWVTDVAISRNEQLKALGNGVVPQQAEAAIRALLNLASVAA